MPIIFPESAKEVVNILSSLLGEGSPEGWLCAAIIPAAWLTIAELNTYLGWTTEEFIDPWDIISKPIILFLLLSNIVAKCSVDLGEIFEYK